MDKQGRKSIEVKEAVFQELSQDRQALDEKILAEEGFSATSIGARAESSASEETAASEQGYFMLGATDKMFSDSSSALDEFASGSFASGSSASDWQGYFMRGATDKMFSDSSPALNEFGDPSIDAGLDKDIDANLASASIVPDKVGFVGERDGSVEVIRYGQRLILNQGDAILHKDIIITGDDSGAFLRFTNSKASQQTLRLDEEQRVVIEDFLAEALVSQLDTPDMDWQMSDGSLVLLPSSDDFAIGYGAGSARARLLQTDSSEADASGADAFGAYASGADKSEVDKSAYKLASREGSLQSASSRAGEYQTGGLYELDHSSHTQEFPQGDSPVSKLPEGNLLGDNFLAGNLKEPLAQDAPAPQEVPADQTAGVTSEPVSPLSQQGLSSQGLSSQGLSSQGLSSQDLSSQGLSSQGLSSQGLSSQGLSSQSSPPSGFGSPLGEPSVPTAEELARLAQEQARAYAQQRAAEEQARAQQAAEEQARAQQAAEEQARAQQAAEEQARAQQAAQAAEEQARAQQAAEEQARAQQAAEEQARAQQAAEEQARAQEAAEEQARAQQAAEEQARAQQAAEEQARAQEAAEEQARAQRAAEEQARAQQAAEEQARAQQAAEEQARAQQAAEDKEDKGFSKDIPKGVTKDDLEDIAKGFANGESIEVPYENLLLDNNGDWDAQLRQPGTDPVGYSLYEQNAGGAGSAGAGETSGF